MSSKDYGWLKEGQKVRMTGGPEIGVNVLTGHISHMPHGPYNEDNAPEPSHRIQVKRDDGVGGGGRDGGWIVEIKYCTPLGYTPSDLELTDAPVVIPGGQDGFLIPSAAETVIMAEKFYDTHATSKDWGLFVRQYIFNVLTQSGVVASIEEGATHITLPSGKTVKIEDIEEGE